MARIRSLHPGQWTDEAFVSCSLAARLLALGLRNIADDQGVFAWKPLTLKMQLFPADGVDVAALLAELVASGQIHRFEADGQVWGAIRNFRRWQRPEKPKHLHPLPDDLAPYVGLSATSRRPVGDQSAKVSAEEGGRRKEEGGDSTPSPSAKASGEGEPAADAAAPPAADGKKLPKKPPEIPMALLNDMGVAWNAMARIHGLPQVSEITERRAVALRARINERWKRDPMAMWTRYLEAIAASPFLRGENPRGWKANLDWAIRPESPVRVAEGRYSDDEGEG
jgi:hypothetical protein